MMFHLGLSFSTISRIGRRYKFLFEKKWRNGSRSKKFYYSILREVWANNLSALKGGGFTRDLPWSSSVLNFYGYSIRPDLPFGLRDFFSFLIPIMFCNDLLNYCLLEELISILRLKSRSYLTS